MKNAKISQNRRFLRIFWVPLKIGKKRQKLLTLRAVGKSSKNDENGLSFLRAPLLNQLKIDKI
jgi:hypothetical protein